MTKVCTEAYRSSEETIHSTRAKQISEMVMVKLSVEACLDMSPADKGKDGILCDSVMVLV